MPDDDLTKEEITKELEDIEDDAEEAAETGDTDELDAIADRLIGIMEEVEAKQSSHDERWSKYDESKMEERMERIERYIAKLARDTKQGDKESGKEGGAADTGAPVSRREAVDRGPAETHFWFRQRTGKRK